MRNGPFGLVVTLAAVLAVLGAVGTTTRNAFAIPGDVCQMTTWDSTGKLLHDGDTIGGDGKVYLVFRIEDDAFGYINDFFDGPLQDLIDGTLGNEIADLEAQIEAEQIAIQPQLDDLQSQIDDLQAQIDASSDDSEIAQLNAQIDDLKAQQLEVQANLFAMQGQLAALQEVLKEYEDALKHFRGTDIVQLDSQTGSARITSKAEVTGFEWVKPRVSHLLVAPGPGPSADLPGVETQRVDHVFPEWFAGPDGQDLDKISAWLNRVAGVPAPVSDATSLCGNPNTQDGWGFVDITCIRAGSFNVRVMSEHNSSENTTGIKDLVCPGNAESASIAVSRSSLETQPVGKNSDESLITVTVLDDFGDRFNGADVTFFTNNCTFTNPYAGLNGDSGASPATLGTVVTVKSDTDSPDDLKFLQDHSDQVYAGTAELTLSCPLGTPGSATVKALVQRPGADVVLETTIALVGPTANDGITLTLAPTEVQCGNELLATASVVDVNGVKVSDGTRVYFTTDTSTGIIGGQEGGQGSNTTIDGQTTVTVAMSPDDPGTHTVIAWTIDKNGALLSQKDAQFVCTDPSDVVAGVVQVATANQITPPNTGDGGLKVASHGPSVGLMAAVAGVLVLLTGLGAGKIFIDGRRR